MAAANIRRHIVLTGPPGVGKTTLIHKTCQGLQKAGIKVQGFYTEELREKGRRIGFDVVTLDGHRGQLARIISDEPGSSRQYKKDTPPVYVVDEVGKMELFSQRFVQAVRDLLAKPSSTILATIPIPKGRPIAFVEEIRSNREAVVFQISRENRDHILEDIIQAVIDSYKRSSQVSL
ncbi:hypothetical protein LSH36_31g06006 [Paralvinella palmiformis]|uniref:AAA+ ATPase domain-containing protein n=1 Tax=Paralvinella palmiformis TaxID=53620 RepID=A0AAD9NFZ9_9ANNE|nr:hypothetical protein LSH36_31g06006 [Paralvinella palmiformis]